MKSQRTYPRFSAVAAAVTALLLTACNSGGGEAPESDGAEGDDSNNIATDPQGGEFTIYNCEPRSLNPGDSVEACGSRVLGQLFSGLTINSHEQGAVVGLVARDWESDNAQNWTFHLRDDFTFHNGEPVTAQSFVDTWNFIVHPDNAQGSAGFFDNFDGYQEVITGEADEMVGVRAIDETTLEIDLSEPFSPLPALLGTTEFYPFPTVAFENIEGFQEAPIGNGRYQIDGVWEHDVQIAMERYEDWPGENPGLADRITWKLYSDLNTAYLDVQAGELDILSGVSPERMVNVETDFPGRNQQDVSDSFTYMGFPLYIEDFQEPDVRHALSLAIDRHAIVDTIYNGSYEPATSVMPPALPEAREDACKSCAFDPERASDLYSDAGGPSEITVWFNSGAGNEEWTEAVANMWQEHLPIDNVTFESLEFAQYLDLLLAGDVTGPYRLGWTSSYPSPQRALEPIFVTGVQSNLMEYSNLEFDSLVQEANGATDTETATSLYQQAEDILMEDLPVIPLWFGVTTTVYSDRVDGIKVDPSTHVRVEDVRVSGS